MQPKTQLTNGHERINAYILALIIIMKGLEGIDSAIGTILCATVQKFNKIPVSCALLLAF